MSGEHSETAPRSARNDAIAAVATAGSLAFLGAIVAGIAGWLLSAGALPRPNFLPVPPSEPLQAGILYAVIGLVLGGVIGGIAHLADSTQGQEVEPPTTTMPE